jgi:hypothetical protein
MVINAGPLPDNPYLTYRPHNSFDADGYLKPDAMAASDQTAVFDLLPTSQPVKEQQQQQQQQPQRVAQDPGVDAIKLFFFVADEVAKKLEFVLGNDLKVSPMFLGRYIA